MILLRGVGSWSEYVAVPSVNVMKLPVKVDPVQAAMLKVNPLTALRMLEGIPFPWSRGIGWCRMPPIPEWEGALFNWPVKWA